MAGPTEQAAIRKGVAQRLYDRCMAWLATPAGPWVLFGIAVAESSFFPIPPDVFLIALAIAAPRRAYRFALICSVGSVLGGILGYGIGHGFMDAVGQRILEFYGLTDKYLLVQDLYQRYDAWAVGAAGFTPIPYKLFTIAAGAFRIDFPTFVLASLLSRSARFFLVAGLIHRFGPPIRTFIDRYFNLLSILFMVLLVGGFFLVQLFLR